jgi:hypothetical protein
LPSYFDAPWPEPNPQPAGSETVGLLPTPLGYGAPGGRCLTLCRFSGLQARARAVAMTDAWLPGMTIQEAARLASEGAEAQLTAAKKVRTEAELATPDAKREATLRAEEAQKLRAELETCEAALDAPQAAASNPVDVAIKNLKESPESTKALLHAAFVDVANTGRGDDPDVEGLDMYEGWHKLLSMRDNIKYVRAFWRAYASAVAKHFNESAAEAARNAERAARMGAAWKEHVYAITEEGAPPGAMMALAAPDISFS